MKTDGATEDARGGKIRTLKMFDGFEKEIESFKGNEETWRKVHAVGGADSFVVYMATGNMVYRSKAMVAVIESDSKSR